MLKASLIVDTVVSTLQTIQPLVTAMNGDPTRIQAFHFMPGLEKSLAEAINTMLQPSILVTWAGTMGGNWDGQTIFKHHVDVYFRTPNTANMVPALAYEDCYWLMVNQPVNGSDVPYLNIRNIQILPGQLDLMDTPSVQHMTDEQGQDYFCGKFIFPEIGDQS
jgi:hypothetical protein